MNSVALLGHSKIQNKSICLKVFRPGDCFLQSDIDRLSNDLFHEILRMKDLEHENVLKAIGFSTDDTGKPVIVLPFMEHGDLLKNLTNPTLPLNYQQARDFELILKLVNRSKKFKIVH